MENEMTEVDMLDFTVYLQYKLRGEHDSITQRDEMMKQFLDKPPTSVAEFARSIIELIPSVVLEYQDIGMGWKDTEPED